MSDHLLPTFVSAALLNPPAHARAHDLAHTGPHIDTPSAHTARGSAHQPPGTRVRPDAVYFMSR